jgi:hypothetical protein
MLIRLAILALAAVGGLSVLRWLFLRERAPDFKCASCTHCRKLFHDGVRCGFGSKEVFKNPAQIGMCPDHESR